MGNDGIGRQGDGFVRLAGHELLRRISLLQRNGAVRENVDEEEVVVECSLLMGGSHQRQSVECG